MYAGVLSSGVAFLLQIYAQQNLNPAPVAIIFSLEGVFAAIFGWLLLNQFLSDLKIFGIALILIATIRLIAYMASSILTGIAKKALTISNKNTARIKKITKTQNTHPTKEILNLSFD